MRNRTEWAQLVDAGDIQSGDVLIKHVWNTADGGPRSREFVELAVRAGNAFQVFDALGSRSAEHAALVGNVSEQPYIFEADEDGIVVRNNPGDTALFMYNNFYTVYRMNNGPFKDGWCLLCDGMATRLAAVEQGVPQTPIRMPIIPALPQDRRIRLAVRGAHLPKNQSTSYSYFNVAYSLLPNLIPDSSRFIPDIFLSKHDEAMLKFISGELQSISYICSGFVASMLQAFMVAYHNNRRVFIDPSQVHPSGIEHALRNSSIPGFIAFPQRCGGNCMA